MISADFLLYVPAGQDTVYVIPRGKIAHDTAWATVGAGTIQRGMAICLRNLRLLLFERNSRWRLSKQLRRVIEEAAKRMLPYALIRSKRGVRKSDYRTFAQRRILIKGKRCAIFTARPHTRSRSSLGRSRF